MIRVIGTAGHVDHGKSTLVEALTGTHPDRLREEREREMTIDLGFAWMTLPDGTEVGIVDVPGHRDFVDNMLAGAGGLQAAILVVAADEGVMPQTREHVAILSLLETPRLVVALTKIDAAEEEGWTSIVEEDVVRLLEDSKYAGSPMVRVSARTGAGLEDLKRVLAEQLARLPGPRDLGRARLPVDRAFVMSGFGTVVTGTLLDGPLSVGDELVILPSEVRGRIRGLQTHRRAVDRAAPGSRVAVNLSGVDIGQVGRGNVLSPPGAYTPTRLLDGLVSLLRDSPVPLRNGQQLKAYLGTADVIVRARLLDGEEIPPGESGWVQFVLKDPVAAAEGDRFILRRPTPAATLGGGVVVQTRPARVHRRRDAKVLAALERLRTGRPTDRLLVGLAGRGPLRIGEIADASGLTPDEAILAVADLVAAGRVIAISEASQGHEPFYAAIEWWREIEGKSGEALNEYHAAFPLRAGMPREELRSRLRLPARAFDAVLEGLEAETQVTRVGGRVARAGFTPTLTDDDARRLADLRSRFVAAPTSPPSIKECREAVGDELWSLVTSREEFVELSDDVVFDAETYRRVVAEIQAALSGGQAITVAQLRDRFGTSRKYALALLEHLDAKGVTIRVGDERRLRAAGQKSGPPSG